MNEHEFVFTALREANPVPGDLLESQFDPGSPVESADHQPVAVAGRRRRPVVAAAVFAIVLVTGFLVGLLLLGDGDEVAPSQTTLAPLDFTPPTSVEGVSSFCDVTRIPVELDEGDPSSVEAFYTAELSYQVLRRFFAPPELAAAAGRVEQEAQRIVNALEAAGWDVSAVDMTQSPEATAAAAQLDTYFDGSC